MIRKIYGKVYRGASIGIFSLVALWLFLMALWGTCFFVAPTERTTFQRDMAGQNGIMLVGFFVLVFLAYKNKKIRAIAEKINHDPKTYQKIKWILLGIYGALSLWFVIGTQYVPRADQEAVLEAAYQLKQGNYELWQKGGYMEMYGNQNGIVLILYLFSLLFGDKNYLAFQLMNAVVLVILMKQMMDLSGLLGLTKAGQLVTGVLQIVYCPLLFYAFFVYGNIIGLSLSLFAIKAEWNFFDTKRKKYVLQAAVGIALAVMIKNNYLIFMLGMLVFALGEIIRKKQVRGIVLLLAILLAFWGQKEMTQGIMQQAVGQKLDGGASSFAWIAMGLQEGGYLPDGWYNAYVPDSYAQAGFDTDVQAKQSKEEIKNRIDFFKNNKEATEKFIYKKTASQWNNPSFQAMCISQGCETNIVVNGAIRWIMCGKGSYAITVFWGGIQFLILFGVILFLLCGGYKNAKGKSLVFLVTFVGGFLFHMMWEAKAQYTISYFMLLFPLAVIGFQKACRCLDILQKMHGRKKEMSSVKKKMTRKGLILVAGMLVVLAVPDIRSIYVPSEEIVDFEQYKEEIMQAE